MESKKPSTGLKSGLGALWPTCREAARLQSDELEKPLPGRHRFGLGLHLFLCKWCRRYGRQIRFLRGAAQKHSDQIAEANPQGLSAAARERIRQKLRAEDKPPSG